MLVSSQTTCTKSNVCNQTLLGEQLDWLTVDHDDLKQDLLERIATPKYHPSMTLIDKWEEEAIARIRHTAILARRILIDALDEHVFETEKTLNTLTSKLRDARNGTKPFDKNDLHKWATMLHELKQTPSFPVVIDKENNIIHGLILDLRKEKRIDSSESNYHELTSRSLISILHDPISSASTSNTTEYRTKPSNLPEKTEIDNIKISVINNASSNRSRIMTPKKVTIKEPSEKQNYYYDFTHETRSYREPI